MWHSLNRKIYFQNCCFRVYFIMTDLEILLVLSSKQLVSCYQGFVSYDTSLRLSSYALFSLPFVFFLKIEDNIMHISKLDPELSWRLYLDLTSANEKQLPDHEVWHRKTSRDVFDGRCQWGMNSKTFHVVRSRAVGGHVASVGE